MSMRVLCLGHRDVVPPDDGGKEGIHGAIAALARRANVTYAFPACGDVAAARAAYAAIGVRAVPVAFAPRESAASVAAFTARGLPFKFAKHATPRAVEAFAAALGSDPFDVLICFHPHVVRLGERVLGRRRERLPILLREHNIEYQLVQSYAKRLAPLSRLAATAYGWITRREEHRLWQCVDAVALLSDADLAAARASGVRANFLLAPEGIPLPPRRNPAWPGRAAPLLYLFNPRTPQSVMNLRLFLDRFWSPVQAAGNLRDTTLAVTGAGRAQLASLVRATPAELDARNVRALGFVDSLPPIFAASLALVSPTFVGGGVRKKVLEAMAHELPVIATSMDVRTCSFYRPGENIVCIDTSAELAAAVRRLAEEPAHWTRLSRAGRDTVERHADWDRFAETMMHEAARLVGEAKPRAAAYRGLRRATER